MTKELEFRKQFGFQEEIVYHYCSIESLYGIISSKSLWLTSLNSTNDKDELKYGKKIINQAINEMIEENDNTERLDFLKKIESAPKSDEYKKLRKSGHYFGTSFTKNKDSLTHWDRYGNSGYGVCIAFNLWMIRHLFEIMSIPDICATWIWHEGIVYNEDMKKQYIRDYFSEMINRTESQMNIHSATLLWAVSTYYCALNRAKPLFKNNGFVDETEYRLIFEEGEPESVSKYMRKIAPTSGNEVLFNNISDHVQTIAQMLNLLLKDKQFAVIGNSIRSYYSMNLSEIWGDALIPEIIIGPRCNQNRRELQSFINSSGLYGAKVKVSTIPIR